MDGDMCGRVRGRPTNGHVTVPFVGRAFVEDTKTRDALAKLSRYETGLWNQLVKARRELRELQARRVNAEFSVANEN